MISKKQTITLDSMRLLSSFHRRSRWPASFLSHIWGVGTRGEEFELNLVF